MKLLASLSIIGSLLLPSLASAKDTVRLGSMTVAAGFCTQASDGTVGVKLDGFTSYASWLLDYALNNQAEVKRDLLKLHKGNTLLADTDFAGMKKDAARFQDIGVRRGQNQLCR